MPTLRWLPLSARSMPPASARELPGRRSHRPGLVHAGRFPPTYAGMSDESVNVSGLAATMAEVLDLIDEYVARVVAPDVERRLQVLLARATASRCGPS
jgi:hypothetical protein